MRRRELLGALAGLTLAACAAPVVAEPPTRAADPFAAMPARGVWPAQVQQAAPQIREAYAFAVDHQAQLRYIPCYCGCGLSSGHRSNANCFVKAQTAMDAFTLDPHGLTCGTCVGIALETKALVAQGIPLKDIRTTIDAHWKGAGPSTPTPYPDE